MNYKPSCGDVTKQMYKNKNVFVEACKSTGYKENKCKTAYDDLTDLACKDDQFMKESSSGSEMKELTTGSESTSTTISEDVSPSELNYVVIVIFVICFMVNFVLFAMLTTDCITEDTSSKAFWFSMIYAILLLIVALLVMFKIYTQIKNKGNYRNYIIILVMLLILDALAWWIFTYTRRIHKIFKDGGTPTEEDTFGTAKVIAGISCIIMLILLLVVLRAVMKSKLGVKVQCILKNTKTGQSGKLTPDVIQELVKEYGRNPGRMRGKYELVATFDKPTEYSLEK